MLRPKFKITFTKKDGTELAFNFCTAFEIREGYEDLTNTAKIIVPQKLSLEGVSLFAGANPVFLRGDKVKIEGGYFPNSRLLFSGYITRVNANIPIEIECEDAAFLLKQTKVNYPSKVGLIERSKKGKLLKHPKVIPFKVFLEELLDYMLPDIQFKVIDNINLGSFRAINATPAQVLDKLKSEYGLFSYFVGDVLNVGFANDASQTNEEEFVMEQVGINSNDLEYRIADEIKIKVKAISMMPDNSKIEVESGDPDGDQRTLHYYNLNKTDLQAIADKWVKEYKYSGFVGSLETFGEPYVTHGDRAKITSKKLPERNGTYLIKAVKRTLSVSGGYRQFIDLGVKIA